MKISYRNIPKFLNGSRGIERTTSDWYKYIHTKQHQKILDNLAKYREGNDYGYWLNDMQHSHSLLYDAANKSGDWKKTAYRSPSVGNYLSDYLGKTNNQNTQINPEDLFDFNTLGIANAYNNGVFLAPGKRVSGDNPNQGYKVDNLYSSVTDWRRLLGREGDWDERSDEFKTWQKQLNGVGWETYLDNTDHYYKLRRIGSTIEGTPTVERTPVTNPASDLLKEKYKDFKRDGTYIPTKLPSPRFDWTKFREGALKILGNPDIFATGRFIGNLINNERVYNESLKAIKPNLISPYKTARQVTGDEATKQGYYRRAAEGVTRASRPITSDMDRLQAYEMEALRQANELRAQGDLADNQEIRRTSDESNQHQWANILRENLAANANRASIIDANARIHNLLALKHSAQWSSLDNFIKGIEYRKRQLLAEEQLLNDLIWQFGLQEKMYDDLDLLNARLELERVRKAHADSNGYVDTSNPEVVTAQRNYNIAYNRFMAQMYRERYNQKRNIVNYIKKGSKITYKKKDDLLYKSAKDVVEHFRKMTKFAYDSINKKPKEVKLVSHPKESTRKYLLGGVAPFTVYTPVALGGETTTTSGETTTNTKSSSSSNDNVDLIKELFKSLQTEGLPSDVNSIYSSMMNLMYKKELYGSELTMEDLAATYIQLMQKVNTIKFNKAQFDLVAETVRNKDAGSEIAINSLGLVAVLNTKDAKISYINWDDFAKSNTKDYVLLTNNDILNLRAYSKPGDTTLLLTASNATSMTEIAKFLKAQLPKIGDSEQTIEGYTKLDSNLIKKGVEVLKNAPAGDYKFTEYSKNLTPELLKLALAALLYLTTILPKNMETLLEIKANFKGTTAEGLIAQLVSSGIDTNYRYNIQAVTGKASEKSGSGSSNENDLIPAVAFFLGLGEKNQFIIQDKTSDGIKIDTISAPITANNHNTGSITFDKLASSDFGGQLNMDSATMGDSLIAPNGKTNIIIGERIYLAELPIDLLAASKGVIKPDYSFLKNVEIANKQLKDFGIDVKNKADVANNIDKINLIYRDNKLPIIYTTDGNKPVLTSSYARFAMVNATATKDAFVEEAEFNDGVREANSAERKQFESTMLLIGGNSKYKLDNSWWGRTELYTGIIYIPMVTNTISALGGTGYKAKGSEYNEIEALQQRADAAKELGFVPLGGISEHN